LLLLSKEVFPWIKFSTARAMGKVAITQKKSTIKRPENQKRTMIALGLGKINRTVEKELTPSIGGMIKTVSHLIEVKEL
jgi:large subunit ribosomal protein L30